MGSPLSGAQAAKPEEPELHGSDGHEAGRRDRVSNGKPHRILFGPRPSPIRSSSVGWASRVPRGIAMAISGHKTPVSGALP